MNNIDELEVERTKLDRKLRGLKNKKAEIVLSIEEVQDEINKISQKELQMFDGREFQTESFKYVRTASNPSKPSWWQVVKADNAYIDKVLGENVPTISGTTIPRRRSTVKKWINWIFSVIDY